MSTVKISELTAAEIAGINNTSDVIVINDASTTKKITVNNFFSRSYLTKSPFKVASDR